MLVDGNHGRKKSENMRWKIANYANWAAAEREKRVIGKGIVSNHVIKFYRKWSDFLSLHIKIQFKLVRFHFLWWNFRILFPRRKRKVFCDLCASLIDDGQIGVINHRQIAGKSPKGIRFCWDARHSKHLNLIITLFMSRWGF